MKLQTKYFGQIDYEAEDVVTFPVGLFGFEEEHKFLVLPFEGGAGSLLCFQSVQTPALAFVAMDPFSLLPDYAPVLQPQELKELGVKDSQELGFYVLCVVKKPVSPQAEEIVKEEDAHSFMIITSATEVFGEGYKSYFSERI